jgi:hypothetical protein
MRADLVAVVFQALPLSAGTTAAPGGAAAQQPAKR